MIRRSIYVFALGLTVVLSHAGGLAQAAPKRQIRDKDIERTIDQLKRYLYNRQDRTSGLWPDMRTHQPKGGSSAWATFALMEAGDRYNEDVKRALDALIAYPVRDRKDAAPLYFVAVRLMALSQAPNLTEGSPYRAALIKDVQWLTRNASRQRGAWGYLGPQHDGDNSCSQFALLALWEADRAAKIHDIPEARLSPTLVRLVKGAWKRRQQRDGGWIYSGSPGVRGDSTVSMTAAGLASIYLCQQASRAVSGNDPDQRTLSQGWDVLSEKIGDDYVKDGYVAFCVQRIGLYSGRRFVGEMDWLKEGVQRLAAPTTRRRGYRGKWGEIVRASFELIFLSRALTPLTFNKVDLGKTSQWNYHYVDVPHFTEYMRREYETRLRWQIVGIDEQIEVLLDAPILLLSDTRPPELSDEQWAKLRDYTLRGGTALFVATRNSDAFSETVRTKLDEIYAPLRQRAGRHYQVARLPDDHPLYTLTGRLPNAPTVAPLWGVSDGTRLLAIVCDRDIAQSWQRLDTDGTLGKLDHMLAVNVFFYVSGRNPLDTRLRPVFALEGKEARDTVRVAWLKHGGNWLTQPYALDALSDFMTERNFVGIDVTDAAPLNAEKLAGQHVAWLTGSDAVEFTDQQVQALKTYIDGGGLLFVNPVGGSRDFKLSARQLLDDLFEDTDVQRALPDDDSGLITGRNALWRGDRLTELTPTRAMQDRIRGKQDYPFYVYRSDKAGRVVAVYAPFGLHDTLDGHTAYGAVSFMPPTARRAAENVLLYALAQAKQAKQNQAD